MYIIKAPVKSYSGTGFGLTFVDGVAKTDNGNLAGYLSARGYAVEQEGVVPGPEYPDGLPTDKWTVVQLKAYAVANERDLGEASKKEDILALLTASPIDQ